MSLNDLSLRTGLNCDVSMLHETYTFYMLVECMSVLHFQVAWSIRTNQFCRELTESPELLDNAKFV